MVVHNRFTFGLLLASCAAMALSPTAAHAQAPTESDEAQDTIVVTGNRFGERSATDSLTPIDALPQDQLAQSGRVDLLTALKVVAPSFNSPSTTGSAFVDFSSPVLLRGLSPGQVLVLVDGRRRHTVGEINLGNTLGRGDITYDLNPIPLEAVNRVEVLRDGATAQYGSDAIAGVVNVILNAEEGGSARAVTGATSEGDGEFTDLSLSYGLPIGDGGVIRATYRYRDQGGTNRAGPDTRQQYFGSNGATLPSGNFGSGIGLTPSAGVLDPREATINRDTLFVIGQAGYEINSGLINFELPLSSSVQFHGFAGLSALEGASPGFLRRAGQDETVRSLHPNGFTPLSIVQFDDFTISAGLSGGDPSRLAWDLSTSYGGVEIATNITNSNNASLGNASTTRFRRGATENRQWTTNLDLTRTFDLGSGAPLRVAAGLEYRRDFYELIAGEPASYQNGGAAIIGGPNNGRPAPAGSQPVPGTSPQQAVEADRDSRAVYLEVEKELFDRLTLSGAARYEDFSDFGASTDYRLAARLQATPWLALRANVGTGFRAPALAQSYFSSSSVSFINGQPTTVRVFSVNEPAARLVGAVPLEPERARNVSAGVVFNLPSFTATIDAYRIEVDDRIVISSQFQGAGLVNFLTANGFPGISAVTFLTNAVDSVNEGVDVSATYRRDFADVGAVEATLAANFSSSELTRIDGTPAQLRALGVTAPLFDLTQQVRFTSSSPEDKVFFRLGWEQGPVSVNLTTTRYGEYSAVALTNRTPAQVAALVPGFNVRAVPVSATSANRDLIQTFDADIITDLAFDVRIGENATFSLGVNNVFDRYPTVNLLSSVASVAAGTNGADNGGSVRYNPISPYGFNGRSAFAAIRVTF
jgi:iron complex outermembrane recepter protein